MELVNLNENLEIEALHLSNEVKKDDASITDAALAG